MQTPGIYCVQGRTSSARDHFMYVQGSPLSFMCYQCMENRNAIALPVPGAE